MNEHQLNTWLNPLIQNYLHYFGATKKPVVWEVGSRDGKDAVEIARRIYADDVNFFWNNADVVAVEANPDQAKVIEKSYPEVDVIHIAASNNKGFAPFMVYHGDAGAVGSSSLNLRWKGDDLEGHQITVETDRLENLIKDEIIDIMKITPFCVHIINCSILI